MNKKDYANWSKEDLVKEIKKLEKRKKYGLIWDEEREPEIVVSECKQKLPILEEVKEKEIKSSNSAPINIIIEGDNYHALSVLNYTHPGKIDVIYIDPPYNTGAKDWKYNNNFVDKNDAYRHSKWLNMMSKRFKLAKNLLKEDGVLICTVDENEIFHLGCLLEELFTGYEIHPIAIVHNPRGVQGDNFSYSHEYAIFVFKKGLKVIGDMVREEVLEENLRDHGGESLRTDAKNCFYPILVKDLTIVGFGDVPDINYHPGSRNIKRKDGLIEVWPIDVKGIERKWVFARQSIEEIKNKLFVKIMKNGEIDIFRKKDTQKPRTVWIGEKYDASTYGSKIVKGLTGKDFPFPKSIYTTRDSLGIIIKQRKEAIVLDYFAGSGTTGHAVMLLNKEDGGSRTFILCTNNENNIAEDICYPRIRKVIEGDKNYEEITGIASNLKYFKTGFVDAETTDENKKKLVDRSTEMLCLKEGCFDEVLKMEDFRIYKDKKEKFLGIIYDDKGIEPFKKELINIGKKFIVYVFSLDESAREEEFEDVRSLVELKPIPAAILNVYRRIFK